MKKLSKLLLFLLLAGVLASCKKEVVEEEIGINYYHAADYEGKEFKMESNDLIFKLDKSTTAFTVTQKSTGKVWSSCLTKEEAEAANADVVSQRLLQSVLAVEYSNVNELYVSLNMLEHCLENKHGDDEKGTYTIEQPDANTVKVNYSMGKIEKEYIIPPSVPDERMMEWYNQMDKAGQRLVDNNYRKLDINNLLVTDNKSELLAKYPDLETVCVWEIRPGIKSKEKVKLENLFKELGYNKEEMVKDQQYYNLSDASKRPIYNISIIYRLDGDKLTVEVPFDEIEYKSDYPITELTLLPYFGAGSNEEDGYILYPEGSGAIINFNNGKANTIDHTAQLYGWDYGMKRSEFINETRVAFPVFGISYNDGAMVSIIEDYSTLANINANVAGGRSNYNYAYASYDMVHGSKMDVSARSDSTIISYEKKLPEGSIKQTYVFVEKDKKADENTPVEYSTLAKIYREYLLETYPELQKTENANAPISVELIAAVDRVKQVLGMPVTLPEVLTDFEDAKALITDMAAGGYSNLSLRYSGWMNGGINHSLPKDIDITSGMGGKSGLKSLISTTDSLGVDLYLTGRTQNAYDSGVTDGFVKTRDAAKYISREVVEIPEFSKIWFGDINEGRLESHYLLRPSVCVTLMQSIADYAKDYGVGVGYEDTGYLLSGDYNQKRRVTREASMEMQTAKLAEVKAAGTKVALTGGNDYVLPYADLLTQVDLFGKDNLIFDKKVPFYEIAIHGLVDYTGNAVNLSGDAWDIVLKSAETGAGLAFTFYSESASLIQGTEYMDFFGANYDGWKAKAKEYATRYEKEMAGLNNQFIADHKILADGVTKTVYEDNTVVYVNTTSSSYKDGAVTIPARDYLVERSAK